MSEQQEEIQKLPAREVQIKRTLTFTLSEKDYVERGKRAAEISRDIGELEAEGKQIREEWKGKIAAKDAELSRVLSAIRTGHEERNVDCIERFDFESNAVQYVFKDRVVEERPMTGNERQVEMDLGKAKAQDQEAEQDEADHAEELPL